MPESLLTILKFCFLALLYLFFIRVLRAVWVEVGGRVPGSMATSAPAPRQARSRASSVRAAVGGRAATKLRVVEPADDRGRTYELGEELTVGRANGCQITLEDTYVSQLHARVFRRDAQLFVEDLGSTNGTYVNGAKVTAPIPVRRGDRMQVGKTVLEVA